MLGQCLLIGAVVAGSFRVAVALVALSSYLFFIGLEGLKRARLRRQAGEMSFAQAFPRPSKLLLLASAGVGAAAVLGWGLWVLLFWGALSLAFVSVYAVLLLRRRERSVGAEWLGILGITLTAGVAWSAGTGRLGAEAFYVWAVCFLYFGASVPYVKLRVRQMKSGPAPLSSRIGWARNALLYGVVAVAIVAAGVRLGAYSWLMCIPFLLVLVKLVWVTVRGHAPLSLAQVGYTEVFYSTVFTVIAVAAFW